MADKPSALTEQASQALLDLVLQVPDSKERALPQPSIRAAQIARRAARKATLLAGTLALPPGVLGWITLLPELTGVWRIQAQMVADIAALHGRQHELGREQMLHCLFRHLSAQLARDVVVRISERALLQQASSRLLGKGAARFVPLIGAVGVGAYAYFDTLQVAKTAVALFAADSAATMPTGPTQ